MTNCTRCGTQMAKGARFCRSCGTELGTAPSSPTVSQPVDRHTMGTSATPPVANAGASEHSPRRSWIIWSIAGGALAIAVGGIAAFLVIGTGGSDRQPEETAVRSPTTTISAASTTSTSSTSTSTTTTTPPTPIAAIQQLVDEVMAAEVAHDWETVRSLYPYHASTPDAQLDSGYAATRAQFVVLQGTPIPAGPGSWRTTWIHVAQDENTGVLTTAVFCQQWVVNLGTRVVVAEQNGVKLADFDGWLDPSEIPADVVARC